MSSSDPWFAATTGQWHEILVAVSCTVCLQEVPLSEAVVPEATDYLIYLCGLDCYERWRDSSEDRP